MNEETPEARACEHCGQPVPESRGTKPRRYCRRSCRQRAYEARKIREAIVSAAAVAVARDRTSRDVPTADRKQRRTSRDDARTAPTRQDVLPGLAGEPVAKPPERDTPASQASFPVARKGRRRLLPPPPGSGRSPVPPHENPRPE